MDVKNLDMLFSVAVWEETYMFPISSKWSFTCILPQKEQDI